MCRTFPVDHISASSLPYSCSEKKSSTSQPESSVTAIAYLNGHRIFFDTRYPYLDPKDWWISESTQHDEREWVASRTRATLSPAVVQQRDIMPPLIHTGEGTPFQVGLNSIGCTSSISIHPDSARNTCDGSYFSRSSGEKGEETIVKEQEETKENLSSFQINQKDERVCSLDWGTPLFLVDYTTLWMKEAAQRLRGRKSIPLSSAAHGNPVSPPIEHHRLYCANTTSSSTVEAKEKNDEAAITGDSPCRTASSSFFSERPSADPFQFSHAPANGNVHYALSDEEEDEVHAFTALEAAVKQGIAALPPFLALLMLPTTLVCEHDEILSPSSPSRHAASVQPPLHAYGCAPDVEIPESGDDKETNFRKETSSHPPFDLSTSCCASSIMARSRGGSTAAGSETGRRITTADAKVSLQPYHHYHTVAFCPEPLALVAGEWNASQCLEELWRSQRSVGSTPLSPVEITSSLEKGEKRYPPFCMYQRRPKGGFFWKDRRTGRCRRKKITVVEGSGGDRLNEAESSATSFPCWAYEELEGFSTFKKFCCSSAFRGLENSSSVGVGKRKEGEDGYNGIKSKDSGSAVGITHDFPSLLAYSSLSETQLAHAYWTLPVEDRAYLQSLYRSRSISPPSFRSSSVAPLSATVLPVSSDEDSRASRNPDPKTAQKAPEMDSCLSFPVLVPSSSGKGKIQGQQGKRAKWHTSRDTSRESTTVEPPTAKRKAQEDTVFRPRKIILKKETRELLQMLRKGTKRSF